MMAKADATKKVTYQVNLKELFGRNISDKSLKKRIGTEIISRIVSNTQSGKDKEGKRFKPYTKEYATKKGTGRGDVDLTLSQQMLSSLFVKKIEGNKVTIGLKNRFSRLKAENHIHGVTLPKRDFLGLKDEELVQITDEFIDEIDEVE
jgi:phage gpG-like protein